MFTQKFPTKMKTKYSKVKQYATPQKLGKSRVKQATYRVPKADKDLFSPLLSAYTSRGASPILPASPELPSYKSVNQHTRDHSPIFVCKRSPQFSLETFEKFIHSNSSSLKHDETSETEIIQRQSKVTGNNYQSELDECKREIQTLKHRLSRLQTPGDFGNKALMGTGDKEYFTSKLQRAKEKMKEKHKAEMEQLRYELTSAFRKELLLIREECENMAKHPKLEEKLKEVEKFWRQEADLIEQESEAKLKVKLAQLKTEHERNTARLQQENSSLKRQVESLADQLEDSLARFGVLKKPTALTSNPQPTKEFSELKCKYDELLKDYLSLKKKPKDNLCSKCKAFASFDDQLSQKLSTIREFLNHS